MRIRTGAGAGAETQKVAFYSQFFHLLCESSNVTCKSYEKCTKCNWLNVTEIYLHRLVLWIPKLAASPACKEGFLLVLCALIRIFRHVFLCFVGIDILPKPSPSALASVPVPASSSFGYSSRSISQFNGWKLHGRKIHIWWVFDCVTLTQRQWRTPAKGRGVGVKALAVVGTPSPGKYFLLSVYPLGGGGSVFGCET